MVAPNLNKDNRKNLQDARQRRTRTTIKNSHTNDDKGIFHHPYMVFAVKVLLVLVILLWLPPLVISKKGNKKKKNRTKTISQQIHHTRIDCELQCIEEYPHLLPEESMNCIFHCISSTCYNEIYYPNVLEPGEVDIRRYDEFEICIQNEIQNERKQQRLAEAKQQ